MFQFLSKPKPRPFPRTAMTLCLAVGFSFAVFCPNASAYHSADTLPNWTISLTELLRVIQFFNMDAYSCVTAPATSEDGYLPANQGDHACAFHDSDYAPANWEISLSELLRLIQFFNLRGYHEDPRGEDGYMPGLPTSEGEGESEGQTEGTAEGEGEGGAAVVQDDLEDLHDALDVATTLFLTPEQQELLGDALALSEQAYQAGDPCAAADALLTFMQGAQNFRSPDTAPEFDRLYNLGRMLRFEMAAEVLGDCPNLARVRCEADALLDAGQSGPSGVTLEISFGEPKVQSRGQGGESFTSLQIPGADAAMLAPGAPAVPVFRRLFAVPRNVEIGLDFSTETAETILLNLFPAQPQAMDAADPQLFADPPFVKNDQLYQSSDPYPPTPVTLQYVGDFREMRLYSLETAAGQYDAANQTLTLFSNVAVSVTFYGGSGAFVTEASQSPAENADFLSGFVMNGPLLFENIDPWIFTPYNMGEELMILTHPSFREAADRLALWKNRKGIVTQVFNVNDGDGPGPDTNAEMDALIQDEYDLSEIRPSYVLLLGDADYIPTFYLNAAEPDRVGSATIGTDWPYANYSPSASDIAPDFAVGRITVDTLDEANAVVDKLIAYESSPPANNAFYDNASIAAQFQCCNQYVSQNGTDQRTFIWVSEWCRDIMTGQGKTVQRIYQRTIDGGCNTCNPQIPAYTADATPRRYHDGTALPNAIGPNSGFSWTATTNDVINAFNAGRFLIIHRDHGSPGAWETPWFRWSNVYGDDPGDSDPKIANGALQPVVFSVNCASGLFDGETGGGALGTGGNVDYLVERLIKMPNGGAIGVFGDTRNSPSTPNSVLLQGFFDALWPNAIPSFGGNTAKRRMGDVLNHGKLYLASQLSLIDDVSANTVRDETHMWHVFGDPTLEIWTAFPYTVTLPTQAQGVWIGNKLRIAYARANTIITATQTNNDGGVIAFGRGKVFLGSADLNMLGNPDPGRDTHLAFNFPNAISQEGIIPDAVAPDNITEFSAVAHKQVIMMNWTNPAHDLSAIRIQRKTGSYPASPTDGLTVYNGNGTSYYDMPPALGTTYYYTAYAHDHTPNYASGVQASATTWSDVTGPANVSGFSAQPVGPGLIQLDWENPSDADFVAVKIIRKQGGCPFSDTDGTMIYNGSGTSYVDGGLNNGETYYYAAYAHDGWPNYAWGVCAHADTPSDITAPADVSEFGAVPGECPSLFLSWENPGDSDFAGVKILRKTSGYSASPTDGVVIYTGNASSTVDSVAVTQNTTYYYTIYTFDATPNFSPGMRATAVSGDCDGPDNVADFRAVGGDSQITLTWSNPSSPGFTGVRIQRKIGSYPTSYTDGNTVYDGADTSFVNQPLENNITYYYVAYAHNSVPVYASGAQASATPRNAK